MTPITWSLLVLAQSYLVLSEGTNTNTNKEVHNMEFVNEIVRLLEQQELQVPVKTVTYYTTVTESLVPTSAVSRLPSPTNNTVEILPIDNKNNTEATFPGIQLGNWTYNHLNQTLLNDSAPYSALVKSPRKHFAAGLYLEKEVSKDGDDCEDEITESEDDCEEEEEEKKKKFWFLPFSISSLKRSNSTQKVMIASSSLVSPAVEGTHNLFKSNTTSITNTSVPVELHPNIGTSNYTKDPPSYRNFTFMRDYYSHISGSSATFATFNVAGLVFTVVATYMLLNSLSIYVV